MKRLFLAACAAVCCAGCANTQPVEELPEDHWSKSPVAVPVMRIGRGVTNIVSSPLDLPATVVRVSREQDNFGYALLAGLAEGVGNCVVRLSAGVIETATFFMVNDAEPFYKRDLGERAIPKQPEVVP